ncbi:cell division protein FtsX [Frigidibacter albus]|uniref:Cell division protein FtsX n=1 Tax=Frigidibacter albus TaxID=1465486 RepID=A0A6L8VE41_9RHOB|nr:cell division protein FtsX [Frigidibacter albus]MZQ87862.1 cell division protein FtsX [Frigidibacter albus]NBE29768.1 cell division protein FtsX [Frigidibacter albus]GGH42863.1 cell division protein FtsX [Frigidibacter albus]
MKRYLVLARAFLASDLQSDRVVPPSGFTARLTVFAAAAMAFLAVFALALSFAAGRLSDRWSDALAQSATIRVSAPQDQIDRQVTAVMGVLETTPGIASARQLPPEETQALLAPWFGPDLPVETLPIPALIELVEGGGGFDAEGLRLRLQAEAPGAVLDDHDRWRRPLVAAAGRMKLLATGSLLLIGAAMAAMITLAAQAALAANGQVIRVLRLVGARDVYIARAFVRRFTLRAAGGAAVGAALAMIAVALIPAGDDGEGFLTGLSFEGGEWIWPLLLPLMAAGVAFAATRAAALRALKGLM